MRALKQRNYHRPDEGQIGDCYRTCVACLLDLEPHEVPHVYDPAVSGGSFMNPEIEPTKIMRDFLRARGLTLIGVGIPGEVTLEGVTGEWARTMLGEEAHFLLTGLSRNGTGHVVVAKAGGIVWDPSLDDSGIVGPFGDYWWVEFIGKLV